MTTLRRKAALAAQLAIVAAGIGFTWWSVQRNWDRIRLEASGLSPNWLLVIASAAVLLAAYAMLVEAWRRLMFDWGIRIGYMATAQMYFVSVLGRYIPGKVWAIAAIGVIANRMGISSISAMTSALVLTTISIMMGSAITVGFGGATLLADYLGSDSGAVTMVLLLVLFAIPLALIFALPALLPPFSSFVGRVTGRKFEVPRVSARSVLRTGAACGVAWIMYGIGFWMFCAGMFGRMSGTIPDFIATNTASYLAGYVAIIMPGGLLMREGTLQSLMVAKGLSTEALAVLAAWTSRIWLTVAETLPGILVLILMRPEDRRAAKQARERLSSSGSANSADSGS